MTCDICKGSGTTSVILVDKKGNEEESKYTCISCNGTGQKPSLKDTQDEEDFQHKLTIEKLQYGTN